MRKLLFGLVLVSFVLVALAARGWWPREPWCGQAFSLAPDTPESLEQCRRSLEAVGKTFKPPYPTLLENLGSCPATGRPYRYLGNVIPRNPLLYCPGHAHEKQIERPNSPWYDFAQKRARTDSVKPEMGIDGYLMTWCEDAHNYSAAEQAFAFKPDDYLAAVYFQQHGYERLMPWLQNLETRSASVQWYVGTASWLTGEFAQGMQILQRLDPNGTNADWCNWRAMAYFAHGDVLAAQECYQRSSGAVEGAVILAFARRDFGTTLTLAEAFLKNPAVPQRNAPYVAMWGALSARALGGPAVPRGQAMLREALTKTPKVWPYPLLLLVNDQLTLAQVRPLASGRLEGDEALAYSGFLENLAGNTGKAQALFEKMTSREISEYGISRCWMNPGLCANPAGTPVFPR